jgi:hypothetical protein
MKRFTEFTYTDTLKLMKGVSKDAFNSNKRMYFAIITRHMKRLVKDNPEELIQYLTDVEQYIDNRYYLYDELFPVDLIIDTEDGLKILQIIESNSEKDLQLLRGKIIGLLAIKTPDLLFQRINDHKNNQWTKDHFVGM